MDPILTAAKAVRTFEELPEWAQTWIKDRDALHRIVEAIRKRPDAAKREGWPAHGQRKDRG